MSGPAIENSRRILAVVGLRSRCCTMCARLALDHRACSNRSCARPSASSRLSIACWPCSMLAAVRRLCEAIALTVASVFLMRWCSSSRISFLQLVGGLALLGIDSGLRQQRLGVDAGLLQQHAQADIFGLQKFLRDRRAGHRSHSPRRTSISVVSGGVSTVIAEKCGYFRYRT